MRERITLLFEVFRFPKCLQNMRISYIHTDEMQWDPLGLLGSSLPSLLHLADMKQEHILFWFMPG